MADTTTEVWHDTINTNLRGIFLAMKYEIPQMLKQNAGHIVNMSSLGGYRAFAGIAPYHASKFAIEAITKVTAKDYAKQNILLLVRLELALQTCLRSVETLGLKKSRLSCALLGEISLQRLVRSLAS